MHVTDRAAVVTRKVCLDVVQGEFIRSHHVCIKMALPTTQLPFFTIFRVISLLSGYPGASWEPLSESVLSRSHHLWVLWQKEEQAETERLFFEGPCHRDTLPSDGGQSGIVPELIYSYLGLEQQWIACYLQFCCLL